MIIFAIDFDGTLSECQFPEAGPELPEAVSSVRFIKALGHTLILNTCREGAALEKAKQWLAERHLEFDYFNENPPDLIAQWGDCRKIGAKYFVDDRNVGSWTWEDVRVKAAVEFIDANLLADKSNHASLLHFVEQVHQQIMEGAYGMEAV